MSWSLMTSHPFEVVPMCMPVSVTGLGTSMTSQTPQLFNNLSLVAVSRWSHSPPLPGMSVDYSAEIAYGKLGPSLAQARRARVRGSKSEVSVTQNSEIRPHMPVLDLSRAFTYSSYSFFSHCNTQRPSRLRKNSIYTQNAVGSF